MGWCGKISEKRSKLGYIVIAVLATLILSPIVFVCIEIQTYPKFVSDLGKLVKIEGNTYYFENGMQFTESTGLFSNERRIFYIEGIPQVGQEYILKQTSSSQVYKAYPR